jgi:hypothetical protein
MAKHPYDITYIRTYKHPNTCVYMYILTYTHRWGLHQERLVKKEECGHDQASSSVVRATIASAIRGPAKYTRPDVLFMVLEGRFKHACMCAYLCGEAVIYETLRETNVVM